jgi:hypothetical protein
MHHPGTLTKINEVIPGLSSIVKVFKQSQIVSNELYNSITALRLVESNPKQPSRNIVECIIWKQFHTNWRQLSEYDFNPPLRARRAVGGLDSDVWLENPLLPDIILEDKYSPYLMKEKRESLTMDLNISSFNVFNDPAFKGIGRDSLKRLMKTFLYRNKLLYSWIETEFLRSAFEDQFNQMGVSKDMFGGRMGPIRYDASDTVDNMMNEVRLNVAMYNNSNSLN